MSTDQFTRLHTAVVPRLWAWASVHLGSELRASIDPEDVVQEVACRAWGRRETFDPAQGEFPAWVFGIARNVLGEVLGRVARGDGDGHRWSTAHWAEIPDGATRATARVARGEQLARLVEWADALDEASRRLFLYRGLEGCTHARVGELLGLSANAAQKRWAELRERLRHEPRFLALVAPAQGE